MWSEEIGTKGFAIQERVFPEDWMKTVEDEIQRSPIRSRAGLRHAMRLGSVRAIAQCKPLQKLAYELLGSGAFPFRATLFDKSASSNWLVAWHQDTALPLRRRTDVPGWGPWSMKAGVSYARAPSGVLSQVLALRIHLDDSTEDNGPLRVLPGTHTLGVLSDDRIRKLAEEMAAVECLVSKGGVIAMRPLLIHASSKSRANMPRRVLHIEYAANDSIASPLRLEIA